MEQLNQKFRWMIRIGTILYCVYMLLYAKSYQFMALNVFLAYIPIEISFYFERVKCKMFYFLAAFWLIFYPNAPYLFTDFFHLAELTIYQGSNQIFLQSIHDWFSFVLLSTGILVYGLLGMDTLFSLMDEANKKGIMTKHWQFGLITVLISSLSSLAIFVGRFDRLHSVHLFTKPVHTLQIIFFQWSQEKWLFVLLFTAFQLILLGMIFSLKQQNRIDRSH
ncbi:membrane protein [Enterococcus wangshanyuanii]|uniref:Membrane protein n=2 Tax=Enterococcus wangshanyuanii TaxID=2005703 RepID=A0ABQ1NQZ1_9ENTE|nr:DUF1361 domain-containing protein [Enterococcus wangshanyuanii]GGC83018.1 membrane protein [Enterococcus wangshanyuanii]